MKTKVKQEIVANEDAEGYANIIQIAVSPTADADVEAIYALDSNGKVYSFVSDFNQTKSDLPNVKSIAKTVHYWKPLPKITEKLVTTVAVANEKN